MVARSEVLAQAAERSRLRQRADSPGWELRAPWPVGETSLAVLDLVHERPGMSLRRLARALSLDSSSVNYHVHRLERLGAVVSRHGGRERRVFPPGAVAPVVHGDDAQVLVAVRGGARFVRDIVAATGIIAGRVRNSLNRLRAEGIVHVSGVEWRGSWRGLVYEPTPRLAYVFEEGA